MSDRYLWDRSGPPDPEVARLEQLLGTLRSAQPAVLPATAQTQEQAQGESGGAVAARAVVFAGATGDDGAGVAGVRPFTRASAARPAAVADRTAWFYWPMAAAAVITLLAVGSTWRWSRATATAGDAGAHGAAPAWSVARLAGAPRVGSRHIGEAARLTVGQWLDTGAQGRAEIDVADIGRVHVDPGTRVRLVTTRAGEHRLQLAQGTLHALIWAPPGQFFVDTPSSTAVDLGCAYTLQVDQTGAGLVRVTTGWVGFEFRGREAFIPAGAVCATRPGVGPGTPYYEDMPAATRDALATLDFGHATSDARAAALTRVLTDAREHDAVTLWHLLSRVESSAERDRVFDRLASLVPPPEGVTRDSIRAGNREMLDRWWDRLGLGDADWWRMWKQPWNDKGETTKAP